MKFISPLHKEYNFSSTFWKDSTVIAGARFGIRRASLLQRIELTKKARELSQKEEFLKAGDQADQLEAALADLMVRRLYLDWGLVGIDGLLIDGERATPESVVEKGPETLTNEILAAIRAELELSEEERKNF